MKSFLNSNQQSSLVPKPTGKVAEDPISPRASDVFDKIRPELTLEKWPAIWRPAKSQNKPEVRTFERKITRGDGSSRTAKVEVGFTQLGNLTTEDQKTYYGLIKQWESKGRSSDYTFFSTRKLARILKKRWGTNVIESTTESLRRLRTTPFAWTNSYRDSATGEEIEVLDTFTILSDLKIIRRKSDGHITREAGYFRFHDLMLKNLLANHTKPLLFDVILGFNSEIAQLLYVHVDLILARNDYYERRSKELFDDLGLHGVTYRNRSVRKRKLEKALQELKNVSLSTGTLGSATLERTKDQKDYKIVFHKTKKRPISNAEVLEEPGDIGTPGKMTLLDETPLAMQAAELVSRFYKLFHNVDKADPRPKEISQAIALISIHGFERAKYIVKFSRDAADRTRYEPQTFGGILQYVARALAEFDYYERIKEIGRAELGANEASKRRDRAEREVINKRLNSLSEGEFNHLYETAKRDFAAQFPQAIAIQGSLFESAIRAKMARILKESETASPDNQRLLNSEN